MNAGASTISPMGYREDFISATNAAARVRNALAGGDISAADRFIAETTSRILLAPSDTQIPERILEKPGSTGDVAYDTLLATALAFSLEKRGLVPRPWMTELPPLPREWLWDGGYSGSDAFRQFIRQATPAPFLAMNILLRERDLIAP